MSFGATMRQNDALGLVAQRYPLGEWRCEDKAFASFGNLVRYFFGRRHGKRAEFSLYIDGHKVPGVTRIEFGESGPTLDGLPYCGLPDMKTPGIKGELKFALPTKPSSDDPIGALLLEDHFPFRGVDRDPKAERTNTPVKLTIEQFKKDVLKVYGDGLHADINAPSPLLQALNVQEPCENLTNAATVSTWSDPPEYTLEQLKADIKEFRRKLPPPPETMFERVQREMGRVLFEPIPPSYFDESFDQVVTAEFERMKKLIWPKDDAEPEARTMLYEAIVTELRRRRKLGIPDPKYLRAQEPKE